MSRGKTCRVFFFKDYCIDFHKLVFKLDTKTTGGILTAIAMQAEH